MTSLPLRVIQVVCSHRFYGIERYVTSLANGLAARGVKVTVLGGPEARMRAELSAAVEAWHAAAGVGPALTQIVRGHPDLVHAHMTHAELAATLARPLTGARLVVTRHFAKRRGATRGGRLAAGVIRRAVDLQLASSETVAGRIDGPSSVVRPGVPTQGLTPGADREPVVLVLQRLEPAKDTATALRAWASSELAREGWALRIVGEGSERDALERLAWELGVASSCRFLGFSDDAWTHLRRASLLLASAPDEPFGLSVVEAMAVGLPVVATASGGHLENVGLCPDAATFPPGDVERAARLLQDLAHDEGRRAAYGERLQRLQREKFTLDRQVEETLQHYLSLVQKHSKRGLV